jgi:carboxyl-terminal processing protease
MMQKNILLFLTGVILTFFGFYFVQNTIQTPHTSSFWWDAGVVISEMKELLDTYKQTPSEKKLVDSMLHAYVDAHGDQFTQYFSPDELVSFQTMIEGDFEGIWAYVEESPHGIYISGVLPGSPAQKSGLLPGDIIHAVDNESMHGKTADQAVQKIRWPAGSVVVLDIFSSILTTKKQVTLLRQKLEIPIISDALLGDILSIELLSFNDYSGKDVADALKKHAGKYGAILLDLRNNGGWTLQSAVDVGSLFLSEGKLIATVEGKTTEKHISYGQNDLKIPLFILVNGQTASAAEILASALHTHLNAPILGSQTYGKWSVQELFPLKNGGQLKITTAHWRTAGGDLLDGVGITPNTVLLPTAEDITQGKDIQKEKALEIIKANI